MDTTTTLYRSDSKQLVRRVVAELDVVDQIGKLILINLASSSCMGCVINSKACAGSIVAGRMLNL